MTVINSSADSLLNLELDARDDGSSSFIDLAPIPAKTITIIESATIPIIHIVRSRKQETVNYS